MGYLRDNRYDLDTATSSPPTACVDHELCTDPVLERQDTIGNAAVHDDLRQGQATEGADPRATAVISAVTSQRDAADLERAEVKSELDT